jgi:hypothetical protein
MNHLDISWKLPWRALQFQAEISHIQRQLELEITERHPLWGKGAVVIGRRDDQDDVLVTLNDGKYANVHLVWDSSPGVFPAEYPSVVIYNFLDEFVSAMDEDALEYGTFKQVQKVKKSEGTQGELGI